MKRLHLERWSGQLLSPRTRPGSLRPQPRNLMPARNSTCLRMQSTAAASNVKYEDPWAAFTPPSYGSPPPSAALKSSKLAALHARLALPKKLPLQTLARTLVHPSADSNRSFNNLQLDLIGDNILNYHVAEHLICTYPRLPMAVLFASQYAYCGPETLTLIAKEWGVEMAANPGPEVDPGLLQFEKLKPGTELPTGGRTTRSDAPYFRRGLSSRVVYDDQFGDTIRKRDDITAPQKTTTAYMRFVRALIGGIYLHAGRTAARTFIKQHILSRHLDMESLLAFSHPVRDLARLCAREDFDPPVARILSETGRASISPVYVVGIYSGKDKLGEAAGSSLDEARIRASVVSLKAWYLYSPGRDVNVPSDTELAGEKKPWEPVHIDIGEIIA
ncbi:60s ribosomal l3 protein [Rutstroemia sp. NJR-2017a BVV2]|nr:60s ribosomal l3 protein [Rutstroemia sp. NJR-2017a BVV2]